MFESSDTAYVMGTCVSDGFADGVPSGDVAAVDASLLSRWAREDAEWVPCEPSDALIASMECVEFDDDDAVAFTGVEPSMDLVPPIAVHDIELPALRSLADERGVADPMQVFAVLARVDPMRIVDDFDAVELAAAWQRMRAWIAAREDHALLVFARRPMAMTPPHADEPATLVGVPGEVTRGFVAQELAARLGLSQRSVTQQLALASQLVFRFPAAQALRSVGVLDTTKAAILVRECTELDGHLCSRVEIHVLDQAAEQSPVQFARSVRQQVAVVDPQAADQRHVVAVERRYVRIEPAGDGMAWLTAFLPAQHAVMIDTALRAAALRAKADDPGEHRTLEQLRADLLVWPFESALHTGVLAGSTEQRLGHVGGVRPQIQVTASLAMLIGVSEEPADLVGYGPISASVARKIAAGGAWRRLLTDPITGVVVDVGTTTYRPPSDLLRLVRARDRYCRFPGCSRPALVCDVDHVVPFPHGPTADHNLAVLCRRHHRFKHHDPNADSHPNARPNSPATQHSGPHPMIHVTQPSPGTLHWRMPSGHEYTVLPENPN